MLSEITAVTSPKDFTEIIHDVNNEKRFVDMLGKRAMSYMQSVVLLYRSDEKLQACTPNSIVSAALRSAACELQVDPAYRQAYIIPRSKKVKTYKDPVTGAIVPEHYRMEAGFQPHYHGLEVLAHRTGLYRYINVSPIYRGSRILEDVHTGLHYFTVSNADGDEVLLSDGDAVLAVPPRTSQLRDATMGRRPVEDVMGYLAYFETFKGQKKTEWMTIAEIEAHASKFSDAYTSKYSLWAPGNPHRPVMQMKTVFIRLTKSMDLSGTDGAAHETLMKAAEYGDEAKQAALEEAGMDADDAIMSNEPIYQTDEFSQEAPKPATPIIINTPPVTTGGQAQAVSKETQPDTRKTAPPLPVATLIGAPAMSYDSAKRYFWGPRMLQNIETVDLELALEKPNLAEGTRRAINIVLEWRKSNPSE